MTDLTDETAEVIEEPVTETPEPLPGRRLREAREAKGLSREEVASQLRLQVRLIEALEEGDKSALPPDTFVSGYLRSYARLLEVPEESVLPTSSSSSEPRLVSTIATKGETSSRDWPARLVTYLVVIVIGVSVAMWWLSQRDGNGELEVTETESEPELIEPGDNMSLSLPEGEAQPPLGEDTMATDPATDAVQDEESSAEEEVAQSEMQEPESTPSSEPPGASSGGAPPLRDATPQAKLELRYEADSWTEVTDSAGRQLAYGIVKAGEVLVLRGEAPFRVFLGYASGVNVYYNGELFDHSPFQRRDVARFRIGRAEHNHPGSR